MACVSVSLHTVRTDTFCRRAPYYPDARLLVLPSSLFVVARLAVQPAHQTALFNLLPEELLLALAAHLSSREATCTLRCVNRKGLLAVDQLFLARLQALKDEDLSVRRAALLTVNTMARNKPDFVRGASNLPESDASFTSDCRCVER